MLQHISHFLALVVLVSLSACAHSIDLTEPDIAGLWKHADKSAWIQIDFQDGAGSATVAQHDGNAAAQGLAILEDIRAVLDAKERWQGKIYSADVDGFVDASLELDASGALVISVVEKAGGASDVLRLIRARETNATDSSSTP